MVHPVASDGTSAYKRQSEIKDSSGVIFLRKIDLKTNSTGALDKTTFWILDPLGLGGVGLHVSLDSTLAFKCRYNVEQYWQLYITKFFMTWQY